MGLDSNPKFSPMNLLPFIITSKTKKTNKIKGTNSMSSFHHVVFSNKYNNNNLGKLRE